MLSTAAAALADRMVKCKLQSSGLPLVTNASPKKRLSNLYSWKVCSAFAKLIKRIIYYKKFDFTEKREANEESLFNELQGRELN